MQNLLEKLIIFDQVGLRYDSSKEVLKNISFNISVGDFYILTGVSGAGKSSLLKLMDLSIRPSRGFINIFGKDTANIKGNKLSQLRRKIGVIFQDYRLINNISVYENIALPLKIAKKPETVISQRVDSLLEWFSLQAYKNNLPLSLSGGQQQMVAIARAIVVDPQLIIADEPTGNIDWGMSQKIMKLLLELNKRGTAIVMATHSKDIVQMAKSNQVMRLNQGRLSIGKDTLIKKV